MTSMRVHERRKVWRAGAVSARRPGVTLVELIVVLAILGMMSAVVGLSFTRAAPSPNPGTIAAALDTIAGARRAAIARGVPTTIAVWIDLEQDDVRPRVHRVTAFPDGIVIADPALGIDRASGRPISPDPAGDRE